MRIRLFLIQLLATIALGVSVAQYADYLSGSGAFCGYGEECETVTTSAYGQPLGIPLSGIGVVGFGLLLSLSMAPRGWARFTVKGLGVVAGLTGLSLVMIQFLALHRLCPLCLIADSVSMAIGLAALGRLPEPRALSRIGLIGWIVAAAIVVLVPICWTAVVFPDPLPPIMRASSTPDEVTVVEVTDFECPHCRKVDSALRDAMSRHKVHLVRLVAPLRSHVNGVPAARAYIAARELGKGEEMAAALFSSDNNTSENCRALAAGIGLPLADYGRVAYDPATEAEYQRTLSWVRETGRGLPLVWVQDIFMLGVPTAEALDNAIRNAKR